MRRSRSGKLDISAVGCDLFSVVTVGRNSKGNVVSRLELLSLIPSHSVHAFIASSFDHGRRIRDGGRDQHREGRPPGASLKPWWSWHLLVRLFRTPGDRRHGNARLKIESQTIVSERRFDGAQFGFKLIASMLSVRSEDQNWLPKTGTCGCNSPMRLASV